MLPSTTDWKAIRAASIFGTARFFDATPDPYLVLDRDLNIAEANAAYLTSVNRELSDNFGRWAWDAFPTDEETLKQAIASFEQVKRIGKPDTVALLRFDVPVLDDAREVAFVLQHPIDVTALEKLR